MLGKMLFRERVYLMLMNMSGWEKQLAKVSNSDFLSKIKVGNTT